MRFGLKRKQKILKDVVLRKEKNVVYTDFVLVSMVNTIEDWYAYHRKNDAHNLIRKTHTFCLIRLYDSNRFKNHVTLREERIKFLDEVDKYVQMRRGD